MDKLICDGQLVTRQLLTEVHAKFVDQVEEDGPVAGLMELHEVEPVLAEDLKQQCEAIVGQCALTGAPTVFSRMLFENLIKVAVCGVIATRQAYFEYWKDVMDLGESPVSHEASTEDEVPF